jgi:uracil phosphoribosyltransferase
LLATVDLLKEWIGKEHVQIKVVSLIAARPGLEAFCAKHPDVQIHVVAVDEGNEETGLPEPGMGDPGDRMFNAD